MTEDTPEGDWAAVGIAIRDRMRELKMSTAELARLTALSETTIRYIGQPGKNNRAALVAISAVLRWRFDHLTNILNGQPKKNVRTMPPLIAMVEKVVRDEIGPLAEQLRSLNETVFLLSSRLDRGTDAQ